MSSPPELLLRVPSAEDAEAIAALSDTRRTLDAREVRAWLANPTLDSANDFRVLERRGTIVGYVDVHAEIDRLSVDLITGEADVGRVLLEWAEERARAQGLDCLVASAWEGADVGEAVLRERGFAPYRTSLEMQVPLDDSTPEPAWPQGFGVRTIRADEERDVHALLGEAMAEQHDFRPTPFDEWAAWWDGEGKRLDLWFAVESADGVAGVVLLEAERAGAPGLGWVESLAVRRSRRRHGLGRALLLHSFRALRRLGRTAAGLSVQADNPTGAVRLYESVGMRPVSERVLYEKRLGGSRLA
jgi:mycothiol synthase